MSQPTDHVEILITKWYFFTSEINFSCHYLTYIIEIAVFLYI